MLSNENAYSHIAKYNSDSNYDNIATLYIIIFT